MLIGCLLFLFASDPDASVKGGAPGVASAPAFWTPKNQQTSVRFVLSKADPLVKGLLPVIVIDPGHGGNDEGAQSADMKEKDISLDIALRMERIFQQYDLLVVLTRRSDVYVPLAERTAIANQYDHSVFVSIHANQSAEATAAGVETYCTSERSSPGFSWNWVSLSLTPPGPEADGGRTLAAAIQDSVTANLPVSNRGVKGRSLYVLSHVQNPAALVECGFLSNPVDAENLKNPNFRQQLAASIVRGILDYEGLLNPKPKRPPLEFVEY